MGERRFGILIASSHFPDEPGLEDLRFPENDVDGLNELLVSADYGQFTQTFILKNKPHYEILLKINQILRDADKDDLVLIYYSGHGKLNPAGKLHLASTDSVISALEATSIPVSTIKDYVDISSSNKIVLILDCCFSGAAGEAFARSGVDDQLQLVSGGRGTYIMTASTGIQIAKEKPSDKYGVFTKHVIEGIRSGEADLDCDGRITMGELYRYVHDNVIVEGFQEPMKWDLNVRGELMISNSGKTPRKIRCKKVRECLLDLAKKEILPDDILNKALKVITLDTSQRSKEDLLYDELLDQLSDNRIKPVKFIRLWDKVGYENIARQTKKQITIKRKAWEKKRPEQPTEQNQKFGEEKRLREDKESKRKVAQQQKRVLAVDRANIKPDIPESDATGPPESPRKSNILKLGAAAGVFVLFIIGIWWYFLDSKKMQMVNQGRNLTEREAVETKQQKSITNSIGMKFVLIPTGSFTMGSRINPEEVARRYGGKAEDYKDEHPPHVVKITIPYYMQITEVSQKQWEKVMGNNPSYFNNCDSCPVEKVTWGDAQEFINKLNELEDTVKYRLPTEAEWEYACRAGTMTAFSFGDEIVKLGEYAWYKANSDDQTHPVGKKKPNEWGLHDMHGNVWEWCQDWYGDYSSDPEKKDKGQYRVLRGGSWDYFARISRSATRRGYYPNERSLNIGFRVARDP
jgi:formylglycine-generating enzyme required for sulfatase activity